MKKPSLVLVAAALAACAPSSLAPRDSGSSADSAPADATADSARALTRA